MPFNKETKYPIYFSHIIMFTFRLIPLGKVWTPLSHSLPAIVWIVPLPSFYKDNFGIK